MPMRERTSTSSTRSRFLVAILCLLLLAALCPSCSRGGEASREVLVLGFREGSVDQERNSLLEYGCRRVEAELGLEAEVLIPGPGEDEAAYLEEDPSLLAVLGIGGVPQAASTASLEGDSSPRLVCLDFPGDSAPSGGGEVTYVRYRVEEGAYLCGFLAGWLTRGGEHPQTNRLPAVAFMGCAQDPRTAWYQAGFVRGALASYPQVNPLSYLVDDCEAGEQARALVQEAAKRGADIVFCTPGSFDREVVEAAESLGLLVILAGRDGYGLSPSNVLTSLILRDDNAVFLAVELALEGDLEPGLREWGIREGIWTLAPFRGHDLYISRDLKAALAAEQEKVAAMDLTN